MKKVLFALALMAVGSMAHAASCADAATEKKLSGAARNSFIQKCEKDAKASAKTSCETVASDKKLAGAARNSFVQKCERDSVK